MWHNIGECLKMAKGRPINETDNKQLEDLKQDEYVKQWLMGLSERTKNNYLFQFRLWVNFVNLTPTEQIKKRIEDLTSKDLMERHFFENKFRAYKEQMESEGKMTAISIKTSLICVASFFGRTVGKLDLKRGDWNSTLSTRIKNKLELKLDDVKSMYAHGNLRDRVLLLGLSQSGFSEVDLSEFRIEDMKNFYETPISTHYFIEKNREKTGETQATCLSYEMVHDLRDLLAEMGNPKEGYIFVSQTRDKKDTLTNEKKAKMTETELKAYNESLKNQPIETKRIHEAMKALAEKAFGKTSEKSKTFKTKMLRSLYNSALLRADLKQEIKDLMMGHQRLGARGHYGYDSQTIIEAYTKAFEYLSINGMQSREDLSKIKEDMNKLIGKQQIEIEDRKQENKALNERIGKLEESLKNVGIDPKTIKKMMFEAITEYERHKKEKVPID